jgi:diguanylate cyclase (GGDEF)-like protein
VAPSFQDLIDIAKLQSLMDAQYAAAGIPIGIIGSAGTIHVATGWQDICTRFHRVHPETARLCRESDNFIIHHLHDGGPVEYRCKNGLWDIAVPICIREKHVATLFVGQFHYENEVPDRTFFTGQAEKYGFDLEEYLAALDRLPVFSRSEMKHIVAYYSQFVDYLIEIGLNRIERQEAFAALQEMKDRFERQARIDYLTGVYNRLMFCELLEAEVKRAKRSGNALSLIMCDLDHFKKVNDVYGHTMGDQVLREFARLLSTHIRAQDILARWGGEEFLLLAPDCNLNQAITFAERMRRLCEPYDFGKGLHITVSFGVTQFRAEDSPHSFIERVDGELYAAKKNGRNRVEPSCPWIEATLLNN